MSAIFKRWVESYQERTRQKQRELYEDVTVNDENIEAEQIIEETETAVEIEQSDKPETEPEETNEEEIIEDETGATDEITESAEDVAEKEQIEEESPKFEKEADNNEADKPTENVVEPKKEEVSQEENVEQHRLTYKEQLEEYGKKKAAQLDSNKSENYYHPAPSKQYRQYNSYSKSFEKPYEDNSAKPNDKSEIKKEYKRVINPAFKQLLELYNNEDSEENEANEENGENTAVNTVNTEAKTTYESNAEEKPEEDDSLTEDAVSVEREWRYEKDQTYDIISTVAYLIGVQKHTFENDYDPPKLEIYVKLERNKNARIVRNLCMLRTAIERNFRDISNAMNFEYKSIMSMPEYIPSKIINQLYEDGVDIVKKRRKLVEHVIDINSVLSDRINNCKELFPMWLNWSYLREIFIMPNGLSEEGTKQAAETYYANKARYPYKCYINWTPGEHGNILYNDKKFVILLYKWHGDTFRDLSKVSNVGSETKNSIYDFLDESKRTVMIVDCENSDPYRLCAVLDNLSSETISKITKIMLYDDVHTASAWGMLEDFTAIPIEHIVTKRIKDNKSLVDMQLMGGAFNEFFRNSVDSFVLVSSDSDYWALISSLPEARFLVMIEHEKCSYQMKQALEEKNIFYCYIDEFYSGDSNDIKINALLKAMREYLNDNFALNANEMLASALRSTRIFMSPAEKTQFYNKHIKPMHIVIDENGDVKIELKGK